MNEAELLFTEVLNCGRDSLYLNKGAPLGKDKSAFISTALKRRMRGEPLQYILGKTEFMGFEFRVTRDVFIPRPETEVLVEAAWEAHRAGAPEILDIGTGCGCIAVSLAKLLPKAVITATDISPQAIRIAGDNARLNNVSAKIRFIQSDLFANRNLQTVNYDIIVSNPPYIPAGQIEKLQPELRYEPRIALDGGRDGLDFYRRITGCAGGSLAPGGLLIMEMGFKQAGAIKNIFQKSGGFEIIRVIKDYNSIDRVIIARKRER